MDIGRAACLGAALFVLGGLACDDQPQAPDTTPPTLAIIQPVDGAELFVGATIVRVDARDDRGIARVSLALDDSLELGVDSLPPYDFPWFCDQQIDGLPHTLAASGVDLAGNAAKSAPIMVTIYPQDTLVPQLLAPADGAIFTDETEEPLRWQPDALGGTFNLQVATQADFTSPELDTLLTGEDLVLPESLRSWLHWRLRLRRGSGPWGPWSESRRVHTGSLFVHGVLDFGSNSAGYKILAAEDENQLLVGIVSNQLLLVLLDAAGNALWLRLHSLRGLGSVVRSAVPLQAGGWRLLLSPASSAYGCWILTLDESGREVDYRELDDPYEYFAALAVDALGRDCTSLNAGKDVVTRCFDATGQVVWADVAEGYWDGGNMAGETWSYAGVALHADGNLLHLIANYHYHQWWDGWNSSDTYSAWIRTINTITGGSSAGLTLPACERVHSAVPRPGGGWIALGESSAEHVLVLVGPDYAHSQIVGLEDVEWTQLGGLAPGVDGDIYGVGLLAFDLGGFEDYQATIFRATLDGALLWQRTLGDTGPEDRFFDALADARGNVAAIGQTGSFSVSSRTLWLRRFDPAGNDITP